MASRKKPSRIKWTLFYVALFLFLMEVSAPGYGQRSIDFFLVLSRKAEALEQQTGIPLVSWTEKQAQETTQILAKAVQQAPSLLQIPEDRKVQTEACLKAGIPLVYSGFNQLQWNTAKDSIKGQTLNQLMFHLGAFYCLIPAENVPRAEMRPRVLAGEIIVVRFLPSREMDPKKVLDVYLQRSDNIIIGFDLHEPTPVSTPAVPAPGTPTPPPAVAPVVPVVPVPSSASI